MVSDIDKYKFLRILVRLKQRNINNGKNIYTQKDISELLCTSRKKVNDFLKGRIYDFWMLKQFAALLSMEIKFNL